MMLRTKSLLAALVCGMAGVVCMPAAFGNDIKVLPGAACIAQNGAEQDDLDYSSSGRLYTAVAREVICPVVKDNNGTYTLLDVDVSLYVPTNKSVTCTIVSRSATGSSYATDWHTVTSGGLQTIDVGEPGTSWTDGYYYLTCSMDASTGLYSYRVEESTL